MAAASGTAEHGDPPRTATEPPKGPLIEVTDLRMRYGELDVLYDVSFTVEQGEVVTLLGPNGAGKTTTVEILEGFRERSAGEVRVLGVDPAHGDERWRAGVGVVLQSWRDHAKWRVGELLGYLGRFYAAYAEPTRSRPREVDDLLERVGLSEQADCRIAMLSGGQRRRLDVAIGIVGRPRVLFLDEPTAGFDPEARRDFHEMVHQLADVDDMTILLTTHDLDEAEKLADRILILAGGRIIADGSADQLSRHVAMATEVTWTRNGERFVHSTEEPTRFVRELFAQYGEAIDDLEVRRATLEDSYLTMVQAVESGQGEPDLRLLQGGAGGVNDEADTGAQGVNDAAVVGAPAAGDVDYETEAGAGDTGGMNGAHDTGGTGSAADSGETDGAGDSGGTDGAGEGGGPTGAPGSRDLKRAPDASQAAHLVWMEGKEVRR